MKFITSPRSAIIAQLAINTITNNITNPIFICLYILIFFNLKIEKEGYDLEHLTNQFMSPDEYALENTEASKTE